MSLFYHVTALQHRLDRAAAALAIAVTPRSVHDTRVAARRIRVMISACRGNLDSAAAKRYRRCLKALTRELEAVREAHVRRHALSQLAKERRGNIHGKHSRALYERASKEYDSVAYRLRWTVTTARWRQRLTDLRELSVLSSQVKDDDDWAVTAMNRVVKRCRRRLRDALARVGRSAKKLHKIRLKVKAMRYLLEHCLSKNAIATNLEVKHLREMQNCLGDMHDEENLLKSLRTEQRHREAARDMREELKARKIRRIHAFKGCRKKLSRLWDSADFSTA
jgi:CHAD domain-containing protein